MPSFTRLSISDYKTQILLADLPAVSEDYSNYPSVSVLLTRWDWRWEEAFQQVYSKSFLI